MSDSTIFTPISTQKVTAQAGAGTSEAAPNGVQGVYIHTDGERLHIDATGGTATTSSMPIGADNSHYVGVSSGQTISYIRGGSTDFSVWFTWVKS